MATTIPIDWSTITNWLIGGIGLSLVLTIAIVFISFYFITKIAKGYIIQSLLLINAWLPSVILSFVTDFSSVPNKVIEPSSVSLVLFPYTWDMCYALDNLRMISTIMIVLSYVAFVHLGIIFCHRMRCSKLWSFPIGYMLLLSFGLGMVNFHTMIVNGYSSACINAGVPPLLMPMGVLIFVLFLLFYIFVIKRKKQMI